MFAVSPRREAPKRAPRREKNTIQPRHRDKRCNKFADKGLGDAPPDPGEERLPKHEGAALHRLQNKHIGSATRCACRESRIGGYLTIASSMAATSWWSEGCGRAKARTHALRCAQWSENESSTLRARFSRNAALTARRPTGAGRSNERGFAAVPSLAIHCFVWPLGPKEIRHGVIAANYTRKCQNRISSGKTPDKRRRVGCHAMPPE